MKKLLNEWQYKIFQVLSPGSPLSVEEIVERTGLSQSMVMAFGVQGKEEGWLEIEEREEEELILQKDAPEVLPERRLLESLSVPCEISMQELAKKVKELGIEMKDIIKWGVQRGWFERHQGVFRIPEETKRYLKERDEDEKVLEALRKKGGKALLSTLEKELGISPDRVKRLLHRRREVVKIKPRKKRFFLLKQAVEVELKRERSQLTPEEIETGKWREVLPELKRYDVTLPAKEIHPGKIHPLQKIFQETRRAFLEMGFEEIVSPHVETSFWDFDALFQPQDHPARDMQDTFYLSRPARGKLPDEKLVEKVRLTHEVGGDTGSKGWGYHWNKEEAQKLVLRTHTTASTIRALAKNPHPPGKYFCVGRVFRNETISYKHLPEFHQVDGIVVDEEANFATLLGLLKAFYQKMGFSEVKFKPAFFPYTEPSTEVFVWMESKGTWIELGGAGIFRPEVTEPLGCRVPVLAWGLGLERLAMLRYGLEDIRNLYWSDIQWLKETPLCL